MTMEMRMEVDGNATQEKPLDDLMWQAAEMGAIAASGFVAAFLLATVLLLVLTSRAKIEMRQSAAQLGWMMIAVQFLDAIPEAAMLADQCFAGESGLPMLTSLFFMNLSTGFAQAFDMMSPVESILVSGLLFAVLHFCVGLLCYSIAADVYGDFEEEWSNGHRTSSDVMTLFLGTLIGSLFVLVLNLAIAWRQGLCLPLSLS